MSNDNTESIFNEHLFDSNIWKNDYSNSKDDESFKYKESEKFLQDENNENNNNFHSQKKLTYSLQPIPLGLKKNNNMNENNNQKPVIVHNLPKNLQIKNKENISLLDKIKNKIHNEKNNNVGSNITEKKKKTEDKNNIEDQKTKNITKNNNKLNEENTDEKNNITYKKENIEDEIDYEEEIDEVEEEQNNINSINKLSSINIQPNSIKGHFYTESGFSLNSNNSNNSNIKQRCCTEPDEYLNYPKNNSLNDPLSGRSDNSGNTHIAPISSRGECNSRMIFGFYYPNKVGYPLSYNYTAKNSFLSTKTNSHNQSGQKIDSSLSNESGQSPHNLSAYNNQYNKYSMSNNLNNSSSNINNNTYILSMNNNNPIENRQIYTSNFNSNEILFKQPFSLNTQPFTKKTNYKINQNNNNFFNNKSKEKQVINLEDIALGKENRTTVMIRNIPIKYTDKVLEKELELFEGKYDCLYMPFDFDKGGNKGYSFLNLKSPYHVLLFYEVFQNKSWMFFDSKKICELNYANFQGINEIKKHAKNYRGSKKPVYYINTSDNNTIEVPMKYLQLMLQKNPNMKFTEKKQTNTFIVNSFN